MMNKHRVIEIIVLTAAILRSAAGLEFTAERIDRNTTGETNKVKTVGDAARSGDLSAQIGLAEIADMFGDYEEAVKWWAMAAGQGDPDALFQLGNHYGAGLGITSDLNRAVELWSETGIKGNVDAQILLAVFYDDNTLPSYDLEKALAWYRAAAKQGNAEARFGLALKYQNGEGVSQDDHEALRLYRLSAEQGHLSAQFYLGFCYSRGVGTLEDYAEAYAWYLIASINGDEQAKKNSILLKAEMLPSQIAEGQQRAKEIQALIERKKAIAEADSDKPLGANIAPSGYGSGFLMQDGYVLSCWHVVEGAQRISISITGKDHIATVERKDEANDIAVLKVEDAPDGATVHLSGAARLGEKIFTMGYPHPDLQGSDVKFTTGSISSLTGIENDPRLYQISAPVQPGNSGGPLFDEKGNLVGIVAAKLDSKVTFELTGDLPQNVNYAIKADYLKPVLQTVQALAVESEKTQETNLLELIEKLKKSVVMIKVY